VPEPLQPSARWSPASNRGSEAFVGPGQREWPWQETFALDLGLLPQTNSHRPESPSPAPTSIQNRGANKSIHAVLGGPFPPLPAECRHPSKILHQSRPDDPGQAARPAPGPCSLGHRWQPQALSAPALRPIHDAARNASHGPDPAFTRQAMGQAATAGRAIQEGCEASQGSRGPTQGRHFRPTKQHGDQATGEPYGRAKADHLPGPGPLAQNGRSPSPFNLNRCSSPAGRRSASSRQATATASQGSRARVRGSDQVSEPAESSAAPCRHAQSGWLGITLGRAGGSSAGFGASHRPRKFLRRGCRPGYQQECAAFSALGSPP